MTPEELHALASEAASEYWEQRRDGTASLVEVIERALAKLQEAHEAEIAYLLDHPAADIRDLKRQHEERQLDDYSYMLEWAHELGAKDGDDMRQAITEGIYRLKADRTAAVAEALERAACLQDAEADGAETAASLPISDGAAQRRLKAVARDARNRAAAIRALKPSSDMVCVPSWAGDLENVWAQWTGKHISDSQFALAVNEIVLTHILAEPIAAAEGKP